MNRRQRRQTSCGVARASSVIRPRSSLSWLPFAIHHPWLGRLAALRRPTKSTLDQVNGSLLVMGLRSAGAAKFSSSYRPTCCLETTLCLLSRYTPHGNVWIRGLQLDVQSVQVFGGIHGTSFTCENLLEQLLEQMRAVEVAPSSPLVPKSPSKRAQRRPKWPRRPRVSAACATRRRRGTCAVPTYTSALQGSSAGARSFAGDTVAFDDKM